MQLCLEYCYFVVSRGLAERSQKKTLFYNIISRFFFYRGTWKLFWMTKKRKKWVYKAWGWVIPGGKEVVSLIMVTMFNLEGKLESFGGLRKVWRLCERIRKVSFASEKILVISFADTYIVSHGVFKYEIHKAVYFDTI